MSGKDLSLIGHRRQSFGQRAIHLFGVAARKVRSPTAVHKESVTAEQSTVHQHALTTGSVTRGVDQREVDLPDAYLVAVIVGHERAGFDISLLGDPPDLLGLHVQSGNWITDGNLRALAAGVYAKSYGLSAATGRAVDLMEARVRLQAYTLSINDGFYLVAWASVVAMLLSAMLRKSPLSYGNLSALQERSPARQETKS